VAHDGDDGGNTIRSDAGLVFGERHVKEPTQAVFNRPVAGDESGNIRSSVRQQTDVKPCFTMALSIDLTNGLNHRDAFEAWSVVPLCEPLNVGPDGDLALDDCPGDVTLTAHDIDRNDSPLKRQKTQNLGDFLISFNFSETFIWPSTSFCREQKDDTI
jgi:hypothetical protein